MTLPKIYADFQNADTRGRLRLNCVGTTQDLARLNLQLAAGLRLDLYSDDADASGEPQEVHADGVVEFSDDERCWVAAIDWNKLRRVPVKTAVKTIGKAPQPASKQPRRRATL